jgi:hypothetical protein
MSESYIDPDDYWQAVQHKAHPANVGIVEITTKGAQRMALGPEQIQEYAEKAYKLFSEQTNNSLPWADFSKQHIWRDLITTRERHPGAEPANLMEECVLTVFQKAARVEVKKAPRAATPASAPPPTAPKAEESKEGKENKK